MGTFQTQLQMAYEHGSLTYNETFTSLLTTVTQGFGNPGMLAATTSEVDASFTPLAPGKIFILNLDATNNLRVGPKSGGSLVSFIEIPPGDFNIFSLQVGQILRYRSSAGTVNFLMMAANP